MPRVAAFPSFLSQGTFVIFSSKEFGPNYSNHFKQLIYSSSVRGPLCCAFAMSALSVVQQGDEGCEQSLTGTLQSAMAIFLCSKPRIMLALETQLFSITLNVSYSSTTALLFPRVSWAHVLQAKGYVLCFCNLFAAGSQSIQAELNLLTLFHIYNPERETGVSESCLLVFRWPNLVSLQATRLLILWVPEYSVQQKAWGFNPVTVYLYWEDAAHELCIELMGVKHLPFQCLTEYAQHCDPAQQTRDMMFKSKWYMITPRSFFQESAVMGYLL